QNGVRRTRPIGQGRQRAEQRDLFACTLWRSSLRRQAAEPTLPIPALFIKIWLVLASGDAIRWLQKSAGKARPRPICALISSAGVACCKVACENAWPVRSHARSESAALRSTAALKYPSRSVPRAALSR